MVYICN